MGANGAGEGGSVRGPPDHLAGSSDKAAGTARTAWVRDDCMQPAGPSAHVIGRRATWLLASALSRPLYEHIRAPDGDECGLTGALSHENSSWGLHPDTIWHLSPIFVWHSFFMSPRTAITRRISPFSAREGRPRGTENSDLGLIEKTMGKPGVRCHFVMRFDPTRSHLPKVTRRLSVLGPP